MRPHPFIVNPPKTEAELAERLAEAMAKLPRIELPSREGTPTERDRALQAAARGEVYAPPGRCKGCGS
jgi:hypothetical protein